eukprot:jgi/Tetstr1/465233/TSEL_009936.t2
MGAFAAARGGGAAACFCRLKNQGTPPAQNTINLKHRPPSGDAAAAAATSVRRRGTAAALRLAASIRRRALVVAHAKTTAGSSGSSGSGSASPASAAASRAEKLLAWLEGEGGMGGGFPVEVGETEQGLPCLVASRAVNPRDVLLQAGLACKPQVAASPLGPAVSGLEPWVQLVLWMVWAEAGGEGGAKAEGATLHPYCASLPPHRNSGSPLFWSEEERALLEGSQCAGLVASYREFLATTLAELEEGLFRPHRSLFPAAVFTPEAFLRAFGWLRARAHPPLDQEGVALVPLADLVQHSGASSSSFELRGGRGVFGGGGRTVRLTADRPYAPGEPIEMNFFLGGGEGLQGQLALDYATLDAAAAGFSLPLAIDEDDPFFEDKADVAELSGLGMSATWVLRPTHAPPDELLAYLRLIHCSGEDAFHLEAMFRDAAWSHFLGPISPENERAVCEAVVQGCRAALAGYPSTVEEDARLLAEADWRTRLSGYKRVAVAVRLGEMQALSAYLLNFASRLERLEDLEYYQEAREKSLGVKNIMGVVKDKPAVWKSGGMDLSK